jgi:hypothetical protein
VVPGTPRALAIANANDKALTALSTAEHARAACNAASYTSALAELTVALTEVRAALRQ